MERTENSKRRESLFPLGLSGGKLERSCRGEALDRSWLDLSPLEYQFPEIEDDEYDANWLYVEFAASFAEYTVQGLRRPRS